MVKWWVAAAALVIVDAAVVLNKKVSIRTKIGYALAVLFGLLLAATVAY